MEPPEEEQDRLAQQQAKMRQVLQAMKEERIQNETTIDELQTELNDERTRSEALEDKVLKLVDMVKAERKKAQEAEQQLSEVSGSHNQEKEEELEREKTGLERQLLEMRRRIEELEEQLSDKEDTKQQQKSANSDQVDQLQGQVKELQGKVDQMQTMLDRQQAQLENSKEVIQNQKDELGTARINSDQLSSELSRQTEEKKDVQTQLDKLKSEFSNIKLELKSSNANDSLAILQSENERLKRELEAATEKASESESQAEEASNRADTFETKLATLVQVLKDLKAERTNWMQREADLQQEVETLKQNATTNNNHVDISRTETKATPTSGEICDHPQFKELQRKLQTMEMEITKHTTTTVQLKQELVSITNKYNLSETTCDKLRDEVEKLQTQAKQPQVSAAPPPPPPASDGAPRLPPPPPPPPAFKKLSGKLEIKKSAKKPQQEGKGGNEGDALKTKLMEEISKGVTLRKVQPSQPKPAQPAENDANNMFSLGAMASMLAKKRMARMSLRIEADDPMKGALDTLLAEVNYKQ